MDCFCCCVLHFAAQKGTLGNCFIFFYFVSFATSTVKCVRRETRHLDIVLENERNKTNVSPKWEIVGQR